MFKGGYAYTKDGIVKVTEGGNGIMYKQIYSGNHNKPKFHIMVINREYAHRHKWDEEGKCIDRDPKELSEKERNNRSNIL